MTDPTNAQPESVEAPPGEPLEDRDAQFRAYMGIPEGKPGLPYPQDWVRAQFVRTKMQLETMARAIEPHAKRHGHRPAPAQIVADTKVLLASVRRLVSHLPGWRPLLEFEGAQSWAAVSVKLDIAWRAIRWFEQFYIDKPDWFDEDDEDGDDDFDKFDKLADAYLAS